MRIVIRLLNVCVIWASSVAQVGHTSESVVPILTSDREEDVLVKAAHVVPTPRQLAYHRREFIAFIHFGPNTFTGREWGNGKESPDIFRPLQLDTDQWCAAIKDAGMSAVVLTVKHHDGFCLWQTLYENHQSVKKSPWREGRGDVLRELSRSCKKYDLKLGVYLSPADLYQIESPRGLYGNGSLPRNSTIPTAPEFFQASPDQARTVVTNLPKFTFEVDDYNRYFLNQLYELLTEYGPIYEVWFDGAHPKRKGGQEYSYQHWYQLIRTLSPKAVIFGKGPDVRWCGNEGGRTRESEWNVIPLDLAPEQCDWPDLTDQDLGSRKKLANGKFLYYLPAETNTSIRHGWFWRNDEEQQVRSPDDVFDIYERSVGGNSVFMLNIPPNRHGRFSERDIKCLRDVGRLIRKTYGTSVGEWERQTARDNGSWEGVFAKPTTFNRLVIHEDIAHIGQRVEVHTVEALISGEFRKISQGTTIGYKKIHRFPLVKTTAVRVRVLESRLEPKLLGITAHKFSEPPRPVTVRRNDEGNVVLTTRPLHQFTWKTDLASVRKAPIRYTLDGSVPTSDSPLYKTPIELPAGGTIKARTSIGGQLGPICMVTLGIAPRGWKAQASSEQVGYEAANAIDGDPETMWHTSWNANHPLHPHTLTIELNRDWNLTGFTYLPRQDKRSADSMISNWQAEVSTDSKTWKTAASGQFANLLNDPTPRRRDFTQPVSARYFRLVSLSGIDDNPFAGIAEIELLGVAGANRR